MEENISKQNKIIQSKLIKHKENIINFHKENNLEIEKKYIELLARHLIMSGTSLEF